MRSGEYTWTTSATRTPWTRGELRTQSAARLGAQPDVGAAAYARAAAKAAGHSLRSAADILMGAVRAPLMEATAQEVDRLISEDVPAEEVAALRHEVRLAFASAPADSGVRHRHLRRRLRVLKRSAAPGPSSWRNGHLQAVGQVASGVLALAQWAALWHRAALSEPAAALWSAACVAPVDSGERPPGPDDPLGAVPRRKIRPIACSEAPVKLAEGILVDTQLDVVTRAMEPVQLGCGAADGSGIIISLVRTWAGLDGRT